MKNIAGERLLFGYFFLAAEEKVTGSKGFESKTIWTMARSVLLLFLTLKSDGVRTNAETVDDIRTSERPKRWLTRLSKPVLSSHSYERKWHTLGSQVCKLR
jgi:hypothetical protein